MFKLVNALYVANDDMNQTWCQSVAWKGTSIIMKLWNKLPTAGFRYQIYFTKVSPHMPEFHIKSCHQSYKNPCTPGNMKMVYKLVYACPKVIVSWCPFQCLLSCSAGVSLWHTDIWAKCLQCQNLKVQLNTLSSASKTCGFKQTTN